MAAKHFVFVVLVVSAFARGVITSGCEICLGVKRVSIGSALSVWILFRVDSVA